MIKKIIFYLQSTSNDCTFIVAAAVADAAALTNSSEHYTKVGFMHILFNNAGRLSNQPKLTQRWTRRAIKLQIAQSVELRTLQENVLGSLGRLWVDLYPI